MSEHRTLVLQGTDLRAACQQGVRFRHVVETEYRVDDLNWGGVPVLIPPGPLGLDILREFDARIEAAND